LKLLVVDVGNTSTAVGLWMDGRVTKVAHCDGGFVDAKQSINRLIDKSKNKPEGLAYVSVVPKADAKWRAWAKENGFAFHQVSYKDFEQDKGRRTKDSRRLSTRNEKPETRNLPSLDYPQPHTIGADRLADAAGAVARYGAPVLVMDFGTALTAAVVTRDKVWCGGVIAPGFPLMRDYLFERTAKLPRMKIGSGRAPKIGRSTEEAMRFGALVGYRGMVREIVSELKKNFREDFRLVATGGFAKWVLKDLDLPFVIDPTLTLYGTGLIGLRSLKV